MLAAPAAARSLFTATALAGGAAGVQAQIPTVETTPAACAEEIDDRRRLACYDGLFRPGVAMPPAPLTAAPREATPGRNALPALGEADKGAAPGESTPVLAGLSLSGSVMSKYWELERTDKRGTFRVKTYLPNFLLPIHYTSNINRAPSSPTQPAPDSTLRNRQLEAKLQLSLRAKVAQSLLLPDADLWFAFTQRSMWQVWNKQDSAPFRSTDYQPEAIYVVPVPERLGALPGGWRLRMLQAGIAHQSNGQTDPLSRSWNRVYVGAGVERGEFGLQARVHKRFGEDADDDDNPDLTHRIGRAEFMATWLPGLATASLTWRSNLKSLNQGSLQVDWTFPVDRDQPEGLRWYVQLFSGYGETLLDYNHRQTSLGLGLTLFQF